MADSNRLFAVDKHGITYIGRPGIEAGAGNNPLLLKDVVTIPTSNLMNGASYKQSAMNFYEQTERREGEVRIDGIEMVTHFLE